MDERIDRHGSGYVGRKPAARRAGNGIAVDFDLGFDRSSQTLGKRLGVGRVRFATDHQELVAAEATETIARPELASDRHGDRGKNTVADAVAEPVVDDLEVVQVEEGNGRMRARAAGFFLGLFE